MRHRESFLSKLDQIESDLRKINFSLNQGNRDNCYEILNNIQEKIDQLKTFMANEPISGDELNR